MKSFFTDSQWEWIAERTREGYAQAELARFLGVHRETIRRGLIRIRAKPVTRRELRALSDRRGEFLRLREGRPSPPDPCSRVHTDGKENTQ